MLDVALFLANVTHMKTVIEQGAGFRYYIAVLTLISFSLALQIVAGVLFIIMGEPIAFQFGLRPASDL